MKPFRHVLHINKDEKQPQGRRPWAAAVGPLFFLKKFSEGLSSVAKDDFRRDRFCRSIANLTQEDCDVIAQGNHTEAQETIDQWESSYHLYELLVSTFIPLVLVLVLAGWSDRYLRRRLVLLVPLVGTAVAIFVDLLLVAFPRWSLEFLYLDPLLTSLGGGPAVFEMAAYALAADTSDSTSRTHSLGRLTNLRVLGTALGTLSGLEIQRSSSASPAWTFATSLSLEVLGLLYVVLVLEEEGGGGGGGGVREGGGGGGGGGVGGRVGGRGGGGGREGGGEGGDGGGHEEGRRAGTSIPRRTGGTLTEVLHPKNAKEVFEVLRSPKEEGGRVRLLGLLLLWTLAAFSRPPGLEGWSYAVLGWDSRLYLICSKSAMILGQVATLLVLVALRWRPVDDLLLAAASEAMSAPENLLLLAISRPDLTWMLGLVLAFSLMHNFTEIGVSSAASKIVSSPQHARLFGLLTALRLLTSPLQRLASASLTRAAQDTFPSAQYLVAAAFSCLNASLAASLYRRRHRRREEGEGGGAGEGKDGGQGEKMADEVEVYF